MTPQTKALLKDPSLSPLALVALLTAYYKDSWLTDEFEHVLRLISQDLGKPHPLNSEKIRALRVLSQTAAPWKRIEVASPVVQALNGVPVNFSNWVVVEPHQLGLAFKIMHLLRHQEIDDEVNGFIAASLMSKGLHIIPFEDLEGAKKFLRPWDTSAQMLYEILKNKPIEEISFDKESNEIYQAVMGRAELEVLRDKWKKWEDDLKKAKEAVSK